jgi:hypothetical protein
MAARRVVDDMGMRKDRPKQVRDARGIPERNPLTGHGAGFEAFLVFELAASIEAPEAAVVAEGGAGAEAAAADGESFAIGTWAGHARLAFLFG